MPIGDVWRCDAVGQVVVQSVGPGIFTSNWVNVWHLEVTAGVGTPTLEGNDAVAIIRQYYQFATDVDLFGKGVGLKSIRAVRQSDDRQQITEFEEDIGSQFGICLPPGVCLLVTGRNDVEGRKSSRYAAGVSRDWLTDGGQVLVEDAPAVLTSWFSSGTGVTFTMRPVLFDRDGLLPTLFINRARLSPGFRSQRRRSVKVSGEVTTSYINVG